MGTKCIDEALRQFQQIFRMPVSVCVWGGGWRKFQLRSTFHFGVKGPQRMSSISVKTPYYSPWFSAKNWKYRFREIRISSERASQGEQSGANFSSISTRKLVECVLLNTDFRNSNFLVDME